MLNSILCLKFINLCIAFIYNSLCWLRVYYVGYWKKVSKSGIDAHQTFAFVRIPLQCAEKCMGAMVIYSACLQARSCNEVQPDFSANNRYYPHHVASWTDDRSSQAYCSRWRNWYFKNCHYTGWFFFLSLKKNISFKFELW